MSADRKLKIEEVLGYLNFSSGAYVPQFAIRLNELFLECTEKNEWEAVFQELSEALTELKKTSETFAKSQQAEAVLKMGFELFIPAYREFHGDLLAHVAEEEFQEPLFLVCIFNMLLKQEGPWDETDRIISRSVEEINDYVGYRPVALLENERKMQPYRHEWQRPLPLFLKDVGCAAGSYEHLIETALEFFHQIPENILHNSYFELDKLEELSLDMRAYDSLHPVNKRTNYPFGEWDPNLVNTGGYYTRFVLRKIILDTMLFWIEETTPVIGYKEALHDASAVLCGTILMATSISGAGPGTHDSSVSLSTLMPMIARQRDAYYDAIMKQCSGDRQQRLVSVLTQTQQPFGHVRQFINLSLSRYAAQQVQHRQLAHFFAKLGMEEASRQHAEAMPAPSARFESKLQCLMTRGQLLLDQKNLEEVRTSLREAEDLIKRGIRCGALIDPWNILAFQAQFPLFQSREDALPDHRAEVLVDLTEQLFSLYTRAMSIAAAEGEDDLLEGFSVQYQQSAERWDRYATHVVEDVPAVAGATSWKAARQVSEVLQKWRTNGEVAGDIVFWRDQIEKFESARSFAIVVEQLLERKDQTAALGLLMQWLSQSEEVGIEAPPHSFHSMLLRVLRLMMDKKGTRAERWNNLSRFFDYLEINAGDFWNVPDLSEVTDFPSIDLDELENELYEGEGDFDEDDWEPDEEDELFSAAYDDMVYRDTTDDGNFSDTMDEGYGRENTEFELIARMLEPRLKFMMVLVRMWQIVAVEIADDLVRKKQAGKKEERDKLVASLEGWYKQTQHLRKGLRALLDAISEYSIESMGGDQDANIEYDIEVQSKSYLQYLLTETHLETRKAEWLLLSCLPKRKMPGDLARYEQSLIKLCRAIFVRDKPMIRQQMVILLTEMRRFQLLYVPYDAGGQPKQLREARTLQTILRFLLTQLPRLGMIQETYEVLEYALQRERIETRHTGTVITEFDQLFRLGLQGVVRCVVGSYQDWVANLKPDEQETPSRILNNYLNMIVQQFARLWMEQSSKMRLSAAERLRNPDDWELVKSFVIEYGHELFHSTQLAIGSLRTILNQGVEPLLDYLKEIEEPMQPFKLLADIENGKIERDKAVDALELIYSSIVDKYDRFIDYNTTTTQSDYGEMIYVLLSFLILESDYDRTAWNLMPERIAHRVLTDMRMSEDALLWEQQIQEKTVDVADEYVNALQELEEKYAVKLLAIEERLNQRFIKPLAVNRMLARVEQALDEGMDQQQSGSASTALINEIEAYMEDTQGAGTEAPSWLMKLETELEKALIAREADIIDPTELICVPQEVLTEAQLTDILAADWRGFPRVQKSPDEEEE
ncbi:hypothetical protein [Polystyrenella longa]|uniref:hypothetical protein n=1 Tax=Polystyrenella longa TaxID=2528007 RepID=UPI0011AA4763|nr:hypothetical protein [Polystyrenella longa]